MTKGLSLKMINYIFSSNLRNTSSDFPGIYMNRQVVD